MCAVKKNKIIDLFAKKYFLQREIMRKYFYYKFGLNHFGISLLPLVAVTKIRSLSTVKEKVRVYIYTEINL